LGYGKIEEDYVELLDNIKSIEDILDEKSSTKDIFETLKEKLSSFMSRFNRVSEPINMPKADNKESK